MREKKLFSFFLLVGGVIPGILMRKFILFTTEFSSTLCALLHRPCPSYLPFI